MMTRSRRTDSGVSLVEVMVAATILIVAGMGLMMVVAFSARADMVDAEQTTAMAAANQKLEDLRDTDWDTLFDTYVNSSASGGVRFPADAAEHLPGLELQQGELRIFVFYDESDASDAADLAGLSTMRDDPVLRSPRVFLLPPGAIVGLPAATVRMTPGHGALAQSDFNDDGDWSDSVAAGTIGTPEFLSNPYVPNPAYPKFLPVMITCTWVGVLNDPGNANDRSQIVVRARIGRRRY